MSWIDAIGLIGLIGFGGLVALKWKVAPGRDGDGIRKLGILGLLGFAGIWIPGAGAAGAAGAFGLWNHQDPKLRFWGALGWLFVIGIVAIVAWLL